MAIAIRGTTPGTNSGTSDPISVTLNGTRQPNSGDVLIIIHGNDFFDFSEMPTPTVGGSTSGVTAITNGSADGGANQAHVKSWYYVVGSTGDLTVQVDETGSAGAEEKVLAVYVLSGVDNATPIDVAGNNTGTGTPCVCPSISPTSSDAYLICHVNEGTGADNSPFTSPGSMTEQYDISVAGAMGTVGATEQLASSGATGTRTFTPASASAGFVLLSIAVKTATPATPGFLDLESTDEALLESGDIYVLESGAPTGGDADVSPGVIARSFTTPAPTVSVGAAPAVVARSFTIPAPAVSVGAAPAVIARSTVHPQAVVSVGAAPAVIAQAFTVPQALAGESSVVTPDVIARAFVLDQVAVSVGAAPAVIARAFTVPQVAVGIGVAPAVIALAFVVPQATVVTTEPAPPRPPVLVLDEAIRRARFLRLEWPQPFIDLGPPVEVAPGDATVSPAVIARAFTIPQVAVSVGAAPAAMAFGPIVNQATVSVGAAPATVVLAFVVPPVTIVTPDAIVSPALIALAFSIPTVTIDAEFFVDKPWKLLGGGSVIRMPQKYATRHPGWN